MRKGVPPMNIVREMREDIPFYSVKDISEITGYSEAVVRSYTKAERKLKADKERNFKLNKVI